LLFYGRSKTVQVLPIFPISITACEINEMKKTPRYSNKN
jgi:hypothetical protein